VPLDLAPTAFDSGSVLSASSPSSLELSAVLAQNGIAVDQPELLTTIVPAEELRPAYFGEIGASAADDLTNGDPTTDDDQDGMSLEEQLTSVDAIFSDWNDSLV
jgi:hypothetical protein